MKRILTGLALAGTIVMAGGDVAPVSKVAEIAPVEKACTITKPDTKDFYVGVNTVVGVAGENENIGWFDMTTVGVLAGYTPIRVGNFETSVEARYATDTADWFDTYTYGAYVRPGYDLGGITAYGLAGYQDGSDTDGEFGYGGGLTTDILGLDVFADYLRGEDSESEVVTIGVNYRF